MREFLSSLLEIGWFLVKLVFLWAVLILGGFFLIGVLSKISWLRDVFFFLIMVLVLSKVARYLSEKEESEDRDGEE